MGNKTQKGILLSLILIILLIVLFFWKETFNLNEKINDQKIGNFFAIISSLATAVSIFLLYRQIKEMQEDRKASNKPDLYPETTYYNIVRLESFQDKNLLEIMPVRITQTKDEVDQNYINIFNIGLGAAKEIEFEWVYDKHEIENLITGVYYYNNNQISKSQHINFLTAHNSARIDPPYFYLKCCGRNFNKKEMPVKELIDVTKSDKPKLNLKITYKDIYNHFILKTFNVIIHAHFDYATLIFKEIK